MGETTLHPVGLIAVLVLGAAMLVVPRRNAVWPLMIMGCFIAPAQRVAVFTLNFDLLRIMVAFGTVRVLCRREWEKFAWRGMDTVLLAFAISATIVYIMQFGTFEAIKYKFGVLYDIVGMYFLCRCLVRDWEDVTRVAMGFAIISVPVALAFVIERMTGRNAFAFMGGVPEVTVIREGRMRCQGAYAHPILAGCYWASLLPLMAALWWRQARHRVLAIVGVLCGVIIIILCASSTPISAVLFGVLGASCFALRRHMRLMRWYVLGILMMLHMVMQAPVWHLISRIDLSGGSTGWHRYNLIDNFIRRVAEWWLLGTRDVEAWGVHAGDVTNQYVIEGVRGGFVTLALFVALIALAFGRVGRLWRTNSANVSNLYMSWALGVSLFIHCTSFLGVSYFGQINMLWYLTLAMIASHGSIAVRPSTMPNWDKRFRSSDSRKESVPIPVAPYGEIRQWSRRV